MKKVVYEDLVDIDKILKEYNLIISKTKQKGKYGVIISIFNILKNKKYHHNKYNIFIIKEPKYRIIMSEKLNDKIINHIN